MYRKMFTSLIVLYPILSVYSSTILSFSIADICMLLLVFGGVPKLLGGKIKIQKEFLYFEVFIFLHQLIMMLMNDLDYSYESSTTFMRYILYITCITVYIPNFFDYECGLKVMQAASIFASIFAIIQAVGVYVFGFYISGVIKFLPIMREELLEYGAGYSGGILRVRSLFGEPAHVANFLAIYLVITLFNKSRYQYTEAIIITIAILCTLSSTGYLIIGFIWGVWAYIYIKNNRENITNTMLYKWIGCGALGILLIYLFAQTEWFELFINRTFINGSATEGRFSGYAILTKEYGQNGMQRLFGNGFVDNNDYFLASYPLMYWRWGILGLFVVSCLGISLYKSGTRSLVKQIMFWVYVVLCIGTMSFFSYTIMCYLSFIIAQDNYKKVKLSKEIIL